MKTLTPWVAAAAMVALAGTAQAALVSLSEGTVNDDTTNLIWLQNWNVNGSANWSTQKAWADNLDFADSTDWRLPSIDEYVHLRTEYGDLSLRPEFTSVQFGSYWSGTEVVAGSTAEFFLPGLGFTGVGVQSLALYAVAVRDGDVAVPVPEPQTLALALLALGATGVASRRRPR